MHQACQGSPSLPRSQPVPADLPGWLACLERRHREAIVLGLERVRRVAQTLDLLTPGATVITVAGTNGKGSTCAYLEAMLTAAGLRVGCYTSPHLLRYHERVRMLGREADDAALCTAFAAVEAARGDTPLTYFEHGTLAAMWLFQRAELDALVLEVGMGGRLDAVNVWDADCAVVTSIDLDHQAYLGDTRDAIGLEKAGIMRPGRPAVCGDGDPPASLLAHAEACGAPLLRPGAGLHWQAGDADWTLYVADAVYPALPRPAMIGRHQLANAACAIAALHCLRTRLAVSRQAIRLGLARARQPGRFQVLGQAPLRVLDVAHNPQAARALADSLGALRARPPGSAGGRISAVLALLADKDAAGVVAALRDVVDDWHVAGLTGPRGRSGAELASVLAAQGLACQAHVTVANAWGAACRQAGAADTICALGSFLTVAELMTEPDPTSHPHA